MTLLAKPAAAKALLSLAIASGAVWAIAPDFVPSAAPLAFTVLAVLSVAAALRAALVFRSNGARGPAARAADDAGRSQPAAAPPLLDPRIEHARLRAQVTQAVGELGGADHDPGCVEESAGGRLQPGRERVR